jgi:hypothetical protein
VGRSASPKDGSASFACLCLWINPLHSWKSSTVLFVVSERLLFLALCAAHFLLETKLYIETHHTHQQFQLQIQNHFVI